MSDLIADIEQFLRTVQAVRAAVEPKRVTLDDLTPGQLRAYAAQLEDDYAALSVEREEALCDCRAWQQSYCDLGHEHAQLRAERDAYAKAAKDALQQCDRLRAELAHLRRWRDLLLVWLGAGALLKDRVTRAR